MKILVVDDHPFIREGLRRSFDHEQDVEISHEASTAAQALQLLRSEHFDVVIMDVNLPDGNGLDVVRELRNFKPLLPVLVLSLHAEDVMALRAIHAGADGYLRKDCTPTEMLRILRKLMAGGKHFTTEVMVRLVRKESGLELEAPHERLSDREYPVMCRIARGEPLTEIATALYLSPNTVSTDRMRSDGKMGMDHNARLPR